ncbi:MAG: hypothetical protein JWO38_1901 [Gemmataceae bacterium]|nr:hypothetical protein [Gemmataceae bacterium]
MLTLLGVVMADYFPDLGPDQLSFLTREFTLSEQVAATRRLIRSVPYPVDRETALSLRAVSDAFVLPWRTLYNWPLGEWVRTELIREGRTPIPLPIEGYFESLGKRYDEEQFSHYGNGNFSNGLSDTDDDEFAARCDELMSLIECNVVGGPEIGAAVVLPVPLGGLSFGPVPVRDGVWLNLHLVTLCEWQALLSDRGYIRMPGNDPHKLAWHRFYPPGTDWSDPRPADERVLDSVREDVAGRMTRFNGRRTRVDGREHLHIEDYNNWSDRLANRGRPCRPEPGLVVPAWNRWVQARSHSARVSLLGNPVGMIEHTQEIKPGRDFVLVRKESALRAARAERQAAMDELDRLAFRHSLRLRPEDTLTAFQFEIIRTLEKRQPLTGEQLAAALDCSLRTVQKQSGVQGLMKLEPPIVINTRDKTGYRLASPQSYDHS